jgi:hypothetical protein
MGQRYLAGGGTMIQLNCNADSLMGHIVAQHARYREWAHFYKDTASQHSIEIDPAGIPCHWYGNDQQINQDPSPVIGIDMITEGVPEALGNFKNYDKTKKYVFFANGRWDKNTYDFGFDYEVCQYSYFLYDYTTMMASPWHMNYYVDKNYQYTDVKPNLFCSLIGVQRPARDYLVDHITQNVVDKNYVLNYHGQELAASARSLDLLYDFDQYNSYVPFDSTELYGISNSIPVDLYNSSRFNLVVESCIDLVDEFHLTEKTIKPLAVGMPFVVFSTPGFLENLRKIGFKTFDSLWSEHYDTIVDFGQRVQAVTDLINDLKHFDWTGNQEKLKAITDHNKINLMYNSSTMISELLEIERILSEI